MNKIRDLGKEYRALSDDEKRCSRNSTPRITLKR